MYQRVLEGYEKALGLDHTSTLDTVNNLGLLYKNQGKLKEAEEMLSQALVGFQTLLGPSDQKCELITQAIRSLHQPQGDSVEGGLSGCAVEVHYRRDSG